MSTPAAKDAKYVEFRRPQASKRRMTSIPDVVTNAAAMLAEKAIQK